MTNSSDYGWAAKLLGVFLAVGIGAGILLWIVGLLWPILGPFWGLIIWLWDPVVWVIGCVLLYIFTIALKDSLSEMGPEERKETLYSLGFIVAVVLVAYTVGLSGGESSAEASVENTTTPTYTTENAGTVDADNYDENEEDDDDSGVYVGDGRDGGGDYGGDSGGDYGGDSDGGDGIDIGDGDIDGIPGV